MDVTKQGEDGLQAQGSWIPKTPIKPILPRPPPICTEGEGNEIRRTTSLESETVSSSSAQGSQASRIVACCNFPSCEVPRGSVSNCNEASAAKCVVAWDNVGTREEPDMGRWNNLPFVDLLALADAASAASHAAAPQGNDSAATNSFSYAKNCQDEWNGISHSSASPWTNVNCMPEEHYYEACAPYQQFYDLDLEPGTMFGANSSTTISQLAPITPEKDRQLQHKPVSEEQYLCANGRMDEEREKPENLIGTNEFQQEFSELVGNSSVTAISTPLKENQCPDERGTHSIDLNKTPQQKSRRKKHRPKVVTEGKRKRTPKAVTPKTTGSKENPAAKRKYVRRKGVNNPSITPAELTEESPDLKTLEPPVTPKPIGSKENTTGKRKYVRREGINKPSTTPELTGGSTDLKTLEPTRKSCRRALKYDVGQPQDKSSICKSPIKLDSELQTEGFCSGVQSRSTVQLSRGIEVTVGHKEAGVAYDLTCSTNQMLIEYISLPESQAPSTLLPTKTNPPQAELNADSQKDSHAEREGQLLAQNGQENAEKVGLKTDSRASPIPNDFNCSTYAILSQEEQGRQSKRSYSHDTTEQDDASISNLAGAQFSTIDASQLTKWMHFPKISKKKRTEKGQNPTISNSSSCVTAPKDDGRPATCLQHEAEANPCSWTGDYWASGTQLNAGTTPLTIGGGKGNQQSFEHTLALIPTEKISKGRPTRVRTSSSLNQVPDCITHTTREPLVDGVGRTVENPQNPRTCIDDLVANMHAPLAKRKRSKKRTSLVSSASANTNEMQLNNKLFLYNHRLSSSNPVGAYHEITWNKKFSIEAMAEKFMHLDINRESRKFVQENNAVVPYNRQNHDNALVLYKRDGTVVPYEGWFDPIKKRRQRPKVNLDEETNRVWKLLLGNINSEGIDGTDKEKTKWWEEERRVFRGRADTFIARMHLVQGDRRFSQWKGSVLDSVVGVFLTQNVSDHLSSSAFMSLAARFPLKSRSNHEECFEEEVSSIGNGAEVCILDPEVSIQWKPSCEQSPMILDHLENNEEKEVVNSNSSPGGSIGTERECCTEEDMIAIEKPLSSQNAASSCQNSLLLHTAEKTESCLQINLEAGFLLHVSKPNISDGCASVLELGLMTGSTMLNDVTGSINRPSENSEDAWSQSKGMNHKSNRKHVDKINDPQSSLGTSMNPSSNSCLHPSHTSRVLEFQYSETFSEGTQDSGISKIKDENCMIVQSEQTMESSSQAALQNELTVNVEQAPRSSSESCNNFQGDENVIIPSQSQALGDPEIGGPLAQGPNIEIEQNLPNLSGEVVDISQKRAESDLNAHGPFFGKKISKMNDASEKAQRKRVRKERKDEFDWDKLRKQAEATGKKRERTTNTMDSLDWEAVRSADVSEIANTIKERGMNNKLAERIKDFLNRLVREHGSIDLEWLRDVPPDQAKEYLLSVRGLGLKSVECVRLLTLHHLAFPVDTNVGRIAVRLGWVPLQPLPESLQLHLLELYPVLESIQKYLWPRLCKLDQRALYELHYQMITFGKVFCTKSKPNCNSCPMRGECRHFASAFASARLALPGPEEKSIVAAPEHRPAEKPDVNIDRLALPLLHVTKQSETGQKSEAKPGVTNCVPIIEEPATPEPECTQEENDIEDSFYEEPDEIPTIKLNIEEFTQNLQNYMQNNMELQEVDLSKALVALTPEAASIPMPKLKYVSRLRTEHQVYELPDSHPLLEKLDKREPDDPCSYLLAIWTPGETVNSIQPPEKECNSQEQGRLCDEKECSSCDSIREVNSQIVRGTLLIPCRTAMRGSFPLNGTYFQVNEVFADHDSSLNPIGVPRDWIWNLPRRTVYFGTSIPTIFKGLSTEGIQYCFWRGYVCVRGFDQKTRAPRPLMARLHFPPSKSTRAKGSTEDK